MEYVNQSMVAPVESILIKHPKDAFVSQEHLATNYQKYGFFAEPNYEQALKEYAAFEDLLKEYTDQLYYLPKDSLGGLDSIYAHDSLQVTKHGAIYFNMGKSVRQDEGIASEKYLKSLGIPTLGRIEAPGTMEGGDILWLDEKTVAIGLSFRTNQEGIRQFTELVKDFVDEVITVPLPYGPGPGEVLHLMSLVSMIDDDLAVVYSEYLPVFFRQLMIERGIELLEVSREEYDRLGGNILAMAPRQCIMMVGTPLIEEELRARGCQVQTYEGANITVLGHGGATCLTHPIKRTMRQ